MRIRVFLAPLAFALLFAVPQGIWSGPAGQGREQAPTQAAPILERAAGELSRVEPGTQSLWIKAADGSEMEFKYTNNTKVTGAADSTEGLANMHGSRVSVQFSKLDGANVAAHIEVLPRS